MTTKDLRNNIDKVLGNSIRCLLPSYWWKRLFGMVIDALSVLEKELKNKAEKLTVSNLADSVEYQWNRLTKVENSLNQVSSNVKQVKILYIDDNDDLTSEQKEINKETLNSMYSDIVIGSVHTIKYKEDYDIVVYVRSLFYTPVVLIDAMFDGSSVILYCSAPYLLNYPLGKVLKVDFNRNTGGINSYELVDNITVDTSLSTTSTNSVQNKVITSALNNKVDKAALDVSNLTTYQEYANAFEAAGYGKGDYYIGFKYRGATAFYFSRTSYRIEIMWVDLVGSVWTSTISNGSNATMRHRCISGGFLHIGNNVAEAEKAENVFMLADSRPTNTTVLFHYDYSTAVAFVKYTQPDAENIDVTFINPQYQYETWRINIKTGESTYVSVEELNVAVDSELSTTSTNLVQNKVITTAINGKVGKNELKTINGKSILGQGDITIEGGEGGDGVLRVMLPDIVSNELLFLGGDFSIANINDALLMLESDMPELKEVSELIFNNMISNNISIYEKIVNNAIDNNGVTMLVDFSKTYPILDSLLGEFGISSESIIHTVKVIKNGEDIQVKFYNTTSENDDFGKIVYELKSTGEVIYSKYDLVLPHNGTNLSDELKKANAEALIYIEDARLPKSMVNLYLIDVNNTLHNISTIIATSTSYDSNLNPTYIIDFINPVSYSIDRASIHNDGAVEITTSASLTAIL